MAPKEGGITEGNVPLKTQREGTFEEIFEDLVYVLNYVISFQILQWNKFYR